MLMLAAVVAAAAVVETDLAALAREAHEPRTLVTEDASRAVQLDTEAHTAKLLPLEAQRVDATAVVQAKLGRLDVCVGKDVFVDIGANVGDSITSWFQSDKARAMQHSHCDANNRHIQRQIAPEARRHMFCALAFEANPNFDAPLTSVAERFSVVGRRVVLAFNRTAVDGSTSHHALPLLSTERDNWPLRVLHCYCIVCAAGRRARARRPPGRHSLVWHRASVSHRPLSLPVLNPLWLTQCPSDIL